MDYNEKYQYAADVLKNFNNVIEVGDFRKFLLLILNLDAGGPEAMLRRLGMAPKERSTLPYDPEKQVYFTKIISGLSLKNQLVIYNRSEKITEDFVNKPDSTIFAKFLTEFERKNLLPKDYVVISPTLIDYSADVIKDQNSLKPCAVGIESLYTNIAELILSQNLKFFFLIEGEKADIAFTIGMAIEPTVQSKNSIQFFDVYVDEEKNLRNHTFVQMKKEDVRKGILDMEFLQEIKDLKHIEMFDSQFTIIVPVTSFKEL